MSFILELQRRKIIRAAALYAVAAWLVLQVTDVLGSLLSLPDWLGRLVVLLLAGGLPVALTSAWFYELGPRGPRRHIESDRPELRGSATHRWLGILIAGLVAAAFVALIAQRVLFREQTSTAPVSVTSTPPPEVARDVPVAAKSIAVLPFVDMSPERDQEYFGDGLAEELLNMLARIPDLRVIARTSSFAFKGEKVDVETIARRLNVSNVLEGSVRKSGERLRITAQLIRASDSSHLWSEIYDRQMGDIFQIQRDIANAVVRALEVTLLDQQPPAAGRPAEDGTATVDPRTYNQLLLGRFFADRRTAGDNEKAIDHFRQALAIDPRYAPAWAALARVFGRQADAGEIPVETGYQLSREAALRALQLDPELADAHAALGWISASYDWDWPAAEREFNEARMLDPGNGSAVIGAAALAATLGRFAEAITFYRQMLARDPLRHSVRNNLGFVLYYDGQLTDAEQTQRALVELAPDYGSAQLTLGQVLLAQGRPQEALEAIQREADETWRRSGLPLVYHALDMRKESDAALAELKAQQAAESAFQIAEAHAFRGEIDPAFEWLERAYVQRDAGLADIKGDPLLRNLEGDARYVAFLQKMQLPP